MPENPARPRFRRWIVAALTCYWLAMFAGTHLPLPRPIGELPRGSDKVFHLVGYAGLSVQLGLLLIAAGSWRRSSPLFVIGVLAVYSVADELLQIPVGRTADLYDLLADWCGILIGLGALLVCRRLFAVLDERGVRS